MSIKCLIPAAGKGTRMRPLTHSLPKAMLPVAGKPTIYHIIDRVFEAGVRDFVIITGYLRGLMEDEILKTYPHLNIQFVEQKEQKGLGHAMNLGAGFFSDDDGVFIVYGDTLFETNIEKILESQIPMIGVFEVSDPRRFGVIEIDENKKYIKSFVEKPENPPSNLAMPGVNFFPKAAVLFQSLNAVIERGIRTKNEYQATDAYSIMLKEQGINMGYFTIDSWDDAGTLQAILETNEQMLSRGESKILGSVKNSEIIDPVYIAQGAVIENSRIGPSVSIGPKVTMKDCHIKNSIIDSESSLINIQAHDSLIGRRSAISNYSGKLILGDDAQIF